MSKTRGRFVARIVVDALMGIVLVLVMATALVEEAPHEYLGLALLVLVVAHVVSNRRWFAALGRGRWTVVRALQVASVLGLVVCIAGQGTSAVVLSKHALAFLPAIPGSALARSVHLACSYWTFVFAFAHTGLQGKIIFRHFGKTISVNRALTWALRIVVAAVSVFGAVSFAQLGLPAYLTGQVQFAAGDPNVPLACIRWTSVAVLVASVFHCLRSALESSR
ncbi:MAG: hypothetical protein IJH88_01290 [Eggerthellaceae bacterium]|nr:hypothetical protein [Eggerthellaceae bacterium]